jgi:hypothetical protein
MAFVYGSPLHRAAQATDDAWSAELGRLFGKHAGDVRYSLAGRGDEGSELRRLYDAFRDANEAWAVECAGNHDRFTAGAKSDPRDHAP